MLAAALAIASRGADVPPGVRPHATDPLLAVALSAFLVVGLLVLERRPGHPVGRLLLAEGLVWEGALLCQGYVAHGSLPGTTAAAWVLTWIWAPAVAGVALLLLVFPDGRLPSRRWRPAAWTAIAAGILSGLAGALEPGPLEGIAALPNPIGVPGLEPVAALGGVLIPVATLAAIASLVARFRRAGGIERRQIAWLAWAGAVMAGCSAAGGALGALGVPETVSAYFNVVPLALLPLAIGAAALRHRLYDVELVVDRTLVAAGLAAFATLVYLAAVVLAGELVGRGARPHAGLATLATAVIALAFQPLRERLSRASARLVFGRGDPAAAGATVGAAETIATAGRAETAATVGAPGTAGAAGAVATDAAAPAVAAVQLRTLGGFRVLRGGELLGAGAWQSKKARTLLKILAARRGRPVPRDELMELLWPGEPRDKLGNRLSVALTTLRGVLDPGKAHPADHFVRASEGAVALVLATVALDAEAFLADLDAGLAAERSGRAAEALEALAQAERRYAGEFLEEDRYEDWAAPLREELRAARGAALRASARLAAERGDADAAVRAHLRVLERDPFDAPVHLDLVQLLQTAGRHGEALHRYREYVRAMREVGVAPAPLPT